ncbi:nuclear transport factor 2 family protein [Aggregatibacter actinomycetemcomitans]|nr:nuclear transport factor 2 family protein [Aggregatibacter actinomycetemcomitans]
MNKPTYTADYKAIEHVLLSHYAEGGKQAKSEIMKPAFHDVATMYSVGENGELAGGPVAESLFPVIDNHFKPSDPTVAIAYIDITGTAASARVDTDNLSGYGFTDYFNLLKINGKWQVVSKIFHAHY